MSNNIFGKVLLFRATINRDIYLPEALQSMWFKHYNDWECIVNDGSQMIQR
jgi:hypothetical protein